LFVALLALGTSGGYLLGALHAQPAVPAPRLLGPAASTPVIAPDRVLPQQAARRVAPIEAAARDSGPTGVAATDGAPSQSADPVAFDDEMRLMSQAIAQRQWTAVDAAALGHTLVLASREQRAALFHRLLPALNRGEVKLTYKGPLF
jgi:hypothetical protein